MEDQRTRGFCMFWCVCIASIALAYILMPWLFDGVELIMAWFAMSGSVILFGDIVDDMRILSAGVLMMFLMCTFQ